MLGEGLNKKTGFLARWYSNPGQPDSEKKSNHHVRQPRLLFRIKEASCHVWWQPDCKTHPSFDARHLFSLKPTFLWEIKSNLKCDGSKFGGKVFLKVKQNWEALVLRFTLQPTCLCRFSNFFYKKHKFGKFATRQTFLSFSTKMSNIVRRQLLEWF